MIKKSPSQKGPKTGRVWSPLELAEVKTPARIGSIWQPKRASSRHRMKFDDRSVCYHVMSRTINGEFFLGDLEKEAFRRMMWRMAKFSGVEVLTYVVMSNHFHILARVPEKAKWLNRFEGPKGEASLLKHLAEVYSQKYLTQLEREISTFREQGNERAVQELLAKFKRRFCDISLFIKELKERFSRWYNKQNGRRGTLWMERFKSVLVDGPEALATMAAYIDLNPVRAGLVKDPMLYEWSGYGEAIAGSRRARRGLSKAMNLPLDTWEDRTLPRYRLFLYDQGYLANDPARPTSKKKGFTLQARTKAKKAGGQIPISGLLQKRISSFSRGIAIGGENFAKEVAARYRDALSRKNTRSPKKLKTTPKGSSLFVMRE